MIAPINDVRDFFSGRIAARRTLFVLGKFVTMCAIQARILSESAGS